MTETAARDVSIDAPPAVTSADKTADLPCASASATSLREASGGKLLEQRQVEGHRQKEVTKQNIGEADTQ
eukprot:68820-Rhodomonas_salina.1